MRKRTFCALLSVAMVLSLCACGTAEETPTPTATPSPSPEQTEAPDREGMMAAYREALEGIYRDHLYPNGDMVDVPEWAQMENNDFAIFDVDLDGEEELIYQNDDATMAGMVTTVYGWTEAPEGHRFLTELSDYCAMAFYDNGMVTVQLSHNQGLAGNTDFWPYFLYRYDPGQDGYLLVAALDAWDGETFPHDFGGTAFPADLDKDGDKVVYWISYPGEEVTYELMDGPEYQQWLDSYLGGANKVEVPWQNMTVENIAALAP